MEFSLSIMIPLPIFLHLSLFTTTFAENNAEFGFAMKLKAQTSLEKDLAITREQKANLDKFRKRVENKLPHDYMKSDLYLVRYLRARNFRICDAEEMLMNMVAWRKGSKMDTIQTENWSRFKKLYPNYLSMKDKEGKPILYFHPGQWDVRKVALSNDGLRFQRYLDKAIDEAWQTVYNLQVQYQNVSQGVLIVNLEGYNVVQHACLQCIPIILRGVLTYEKYYPGIAEKIIIVNTPAAFEPLLKTIRGVLSPPTDKALRIYGMNKREWKAKLAKYIDKSQLPEELGGTFVADENNFFSYAKHV